MCSRDKQTAYRQEESPSNSRTIDTFINLEEMSNSLLPKMHKGRNLFC